MFSTSTFKDAAERAIAAVCQTFLALVGTDGAGMLDVGILDSGKAALVAGVLSIVKSYAAVRGPIGGPDASLVDLTPQSESDFDD
jgi:hypothetical protein|tara:strand:- start:59 stop:313 length:255 start_codon:yes stop_codon:yes gene_type:complete